MLIDSMCRRLEWSGVREFTGLGEEVVVRGRGSGRVRFGGGSGVVVVVED